MFETGGQVQAPDDEATRVLRDPGSAGLTEGHAALVEPGSFQAAVITADGDLQWADPGFLDLVGDLGGSEDGRRLVARARRTGKATGLVATASGRGSVAVQARLPSTGAGWPLPPEALAALGETQGAVLLVAFAPSRSPGIVAMAAQALGLSPRESDLARALLEAPNLEVAAAQIGISRETAKDTLARACRRAGARNASELVSYLLDLSCAALPSEDALGELLGLTQREARVAMGAARGESVAETARALGIAETTVKSHRKTVFAKTGARRDRDLRRLIAEVAGATVLEASPEVMLDDRAARERLRVIRRPNGRRVAFIDYGPARGAPVLVMHGHVDLRRLPAGFASRLIRDGWRPIVVQRPGFGLTDRAKKDFIAEAADDMAAVLADVTAQPAALFARGPATPVALAFAARHPDRFLRGVIANPHPTRENAPGGASIMDTATRLLLRRPALTALIVDRMFRWSNSRSVRALAERIHAELEDKLPPDRPDMLDHLVHNTISLHARTTRGLMDELSLYAAGWRTPQDMTVGPWRIAVSKDSWSLVEAETCRALPGYERREIEGVVVLRAYTDPDALADLLQP